MPPVEPAPLGAAGAGEELIDNDADKAALRKVDLRLLPFISFLYLLCYLDRSNISNVKSQLSADIGLNEAQFAQAVSIFYIAGARALKAVATGYIIIEIPSNLMLKRINPAFWIGCIVIAFGICSTCMIFVSDFPDLLIVRSFLGVAEGGFFPGVVFILTFWYRREELGLRIALFYCSSALAGAFGGLLAYAILNIGTLWGLQGWQLVFLFEGSPSVLFGILTWFYMPTFPPVAKWLTEAERAIIDGRVAKQRTVTKKIDMKQFRATLISVKVWGFCLMFLSVVTPGYAVSFYLPTIIVQAGFDDPVTANLMASPVWLVAAVVIIVNAWLSDRYRRRDLNIILPAAVGCIGFVLLGAGNYLDNFGLQYFAMYLACPATVCLIPITLAWMTDTVRGSTRTSVAHAMTVGIGNIGGMLGPKLYSSLSTCLFVEIGTRGPINTPCLTAQEAGPELCPPDSTGTPSCPWETSYLYAHFSMAACMLCTVILGLLVKRFGKVDEEGRHRDGPRQIVEHQHPDDVKSLEKLRSSKSINREMSNGGDESQPLLR